MSCRLAYLPTPKDSPLPLCLEKVPVTGRLFPVVEVNASFPQVAYEQYDPCSAILFVLAVIPLLRLAVKRLFQGVEFGIWIMVRPSKLAS